MLLSAWGCGLQCTEALRHGFNVRDTILTYFPALPPPSLPDTRHVWSGLMTVVSFVSLCFILHRFAIFDNTMRCSSSHGMGNRSHCPATNSLSFDNMRH